MSSDSPSDGALLFPQDALVVARQVVSRSYTQEDHKAPARDVDRIQRGLFTGDLPLRKQRMGAAGRIPRVERNVPSGTVRAWGPSLYKLHTWACKLDCKGL